MYEIELNPQWFISEFKISNRTSSDFIRMLNLILPELINENFKKLFVVHEVDNSSNNSFSFKVLTDTQEQMESVKTFSRKILEQMPFIVENHDMTKEYSVQKSQLKLLLEKCVFINTLNKNLPEKEVTVKKMKI